MAKRIYKEIEKIYKTPITGIKLLPPKEDVHHLEAIISGPEETAYKGGKFRIEIILREEYPFKPPEIRFLTPIYHMNVCQKTGQVCLPKTTKDEWNPTMTLELVLHAIYALLIKPEERFPLDQKMLQLYQTQRGTYAANAKASAAKAKAS